MSIANQVIEKAHGKAKPFELLLLKNGSIVWSEKHQTHHLAWASGENWKLLNQENTYAIREAAQQGVQRTGLQVASQNGIYSDNPNDDEGDK